MNFTMKQIFFTISNKQSQKWKARKQKLKEQREAIQQQKYYKQCTFKPELNPQTQYNYNISNPGSFLKRQQDWVNKKQKKIQDMARQRENKIKKLCSFHPKISKKSYAILNKKMSTLGIQFNQENENEENVSLEQSTSKINLNSSSSILKKNFYPNSYKQIHMKKENIVKELQKSNSFRQFNLMTQKRNKQRKRQRQNYPMTDRNFQRFDKSTTYRRYPQSRNLFTSQTQQNKTTFIEQLQIQNITGLMSKAQEQDTFNSLSSLELKTQRKDCDKNQDSKQMRNKQILQQQKEADQQQDQEQQQETSNNSS